MNGIRFSAWLLFVLSCAWVCAAQEPSPEQLLLKDFRPRSIYQVPVTKMEKARFPVIDMHTHNYAKTDEQLAEWVRTMDEVGIKKAVILSGAYGREFDAILARYQKYPGRFFVWCGFDTTGYDQPGYGPAAVAELERCFKAGAGGVGELGDKGKGLFYSNLQLGECTSTIHAWIRCSNDAASSECRSAFMSPTPCGCTSRWTNTMTG